uniref:Uncharacterized protein n=1 Tax=Cannabis sativa TaxID=3483 RepID=A0A803R770_CANSA
MWIVESLGHEMTAQRCRIPTRPHYVSYISTKIIGSGWLLFMALAAAYNPRVLVMLLSEAGRYLGLIQN